MEPRGGRASALVVLLHGYGANGDDLICLGEAGKHRLPAVAFVAPNAPEAIPACRGAAMVSAHPARSQRVLARGGGRRGRRSTAFSTRAARYWASAAERLGAGRLQPGHHDGAARRAAPRARSRRHRRLLGPAGWAGALAEITARPPVLLVHGEADDLIPVEALHMAREQLAARGRPVEWHVRPGLGHGIDRGRSAAWRRHFIGDRPSREPRQRLVKSSNSLMRPAAWPRLHIPDTRG